MKIEIIEFYPVEYCKEKGILTGTLRIKLPDIGIHIMGIYVSKRKDYWHFMLPRQKGVNHQTGESVHYPFIAFEDKERQAQLINAIRQQAAAFIEKRLIDTENPLIIWPQKQKIEEKKNRLQSSKDNAIGAKQTGKESIRPAPSIVSKVWQYPPPRKTMKKSCAYGKYSR
jgi:hypothetical protein